MKIKLQLSKKSIIFNLIISLSAAILPIILFQAYDKGIIFGVLFLVSLSISVEVSKWLYQVVVEILLLAASSCLLFRICQMCLDEAGYINQMPLWEIALNLLITIAFSLIICALIGNMRIANSLVMIVFLLLATINKYIVDFRGTELKLIDFTYVKTALDVAGGYNLTINSKMLNAWLFLVWFLLVSNYVVKFKYTEKKKPMPISHRGALALVGGAFVIILGINSSEIPKYRWLNVGSSSNGFILNFFADTGIYKLPVPDGLETFDADAYESEYAEEETKSGGGKYPDIIVVMNETFSDLRIYGGELNTNIDIMPFFDSLSDNVEKGYALASIYGGGTANSEYEFLTGNSLAFLPSGSMAYQQYVKEDSWSLTKYLESIGYNSLAMHPGYSNAWMRGTAWKRLGFDERMFYDSFPNENMVRGYVSDQEMYETLIDEYSKRTENSEDPLFIFGVTIQNHSGFDYVGEEFQNTVELQGYSEEYPLTEQYLTLLNQSDQALEYLIHSLEQSERDVIVLFYGDHQARIETEFFEELNGSPISDLSAQEKTYTIPYFVWANYDIEESTDNYTSINFLGNHLLNYTNVETPTYFNFLKDVEQEVPRMNVLGYYSKINDTYETYDNKDSQARDWLEEYEVLQYLSID